MGIPAFSGQLLQLRGRARVWEEQRPIARSLNLLTACRLPKLQQHSKTELVIYSTSKISVETSQSAIYICATADPQEVPGHFQMLPTRSRVTACTSSTLSCSMQGCLHFPCSEKCMLYFQSPLHESNTSVTKGAPDMNERSQPLTVAYLTAIQH